MLLREFALSMRSDYIIMMKRLVPIVVGFCGARWHGFTWLDGSFNYQFSLLLIKISFENRRSVAAAKLHSR